MASHTHTNQADAPVPQRPKKSLRRTLFFEVFALLTFTVVATSVTAFFLTKSEMENRVFAELQSIATAKEELLQTVIATQREQVAVLARNRSLSTLPAVTRLIGFQGVFTLGAGGDVSVVAGESPDAASLAELTESQRSSERSFVPVFSQQGWVSYFILSPTIDERRMVAHFRADPLLSELLRVDDLDPHTDVQIGVREGGDLILLHSALHPDSSSPLFLGSLEVRARDSLPLALAVDGKEGFVRGMDYAGVAVLAAYRSVPSVGWGMVVQRDAFAVTQPILKLATALLLAGLVLVSLLSLTMLQLAARITAPLNILVRKLEGLEARRWLFTRNIFTGNELETVDAAAFDLTNRLRKVYVHLEELVRERTAKLVEQNALAEAIFQSIEYGLLVTDAEGGTTLINRAAEQLIGTTNAEAVGRPFSEVLTLVTRAGPPVSMSEHPIAHVLATRNRFVSGHTTEVLLKGAGAHVLSVSLFVVPILRKKRCVGTVAIFRDVTEEQRVDRMKSDFISLVSHQLRTPLSSMRWNLELLLAEENGALSGAQRDYVREVDAANQRMVRLVEALLNVSQLEMGTLAARDQKVDVAELAIRCRDLFVLETERKHVRVSLHVPPGGQSAVRSDPILLQLILENLIGNAVKYSPEGAAVDVSVNPSDGGVRVSVADSGIGIPPEAKPHIFEKMFRAKNAVESDTDGNGLGLYLSRIAADAIRAALSFESEIGRGTTFHVDLPTGGSDRTA